MICVSAIGIVCTHLVTWGIPIADTTAYENPVVGKAVYRSLEGCDTTSERLSLTSGCLATPKPHDHFRVVYGVAPHEPKFWTRQLPGITVTKPKRRKVHAAPTETTGSITSSEFIEQALRKGVVYGAQYGGAILGLKLSPFLGPAAPLGPLIGSWAGCTTSLQGMAHNDFYVKERWDLHPELVWGNFFHTAVGCSVIGFLQRYQEAQNPRDKGFALLGGLAPIPHPISLVGQLAPAVDAVLPQDALAAKKRAKKP